MPGLTQDIYGNQRLVVMRNITTSTDLPKGQKAELASAAKNGLTLDVPEGSCAVGHLLLVRFFEEQAYQKVRNSPRSVQDKAQLFAVTARVESLAKGAAGRAVATLVLQQDAGKAWADLVKGLAAAATAPPKKFKAKG